MDYSVCTIFPIPYNSLTHHRSLSALFLAIGIRMPLLPMRQNAVYQGSPQYCCSVHYAHNLSNGLCQRWANTSFIPKAYQLASVPDAAELARPHEAANSGLGTEEHPEHGNKSLVFTVEAGSSVKRLD